VSHARDAELGIVLAAARRGEASALAELFEAHRDRVARVVLRMTGDPTVVDDLVQEVFIAAFAAIREFRGDAQLDTWLHAIASNKVRNWWDSRRRREAREQRAGTLTTSEVSSPEDEAAAAEHLRRFYAALGALPDKLREAFTARAIERMSLAEASTALGVPVSTVSYRTRRAEELLCEALGLPAPVDRKEEP
jgi:RNA polymerase sigma-70 factor (ECF subfamily)